MAPLYFVFLFFSLYFFNACTSPEERLKNKAAAIHAEVLTLDSHVDTPLMLMREGFNIGERNDPHDRGGKLDFPRMEEGGLDAVFFAVFLGQGALTPEAYEQNHQRALGIFNLIHDMLDEHQDVAGLALTPDDAYRLRDEGRFAIYIGNENAYPIGKDLSLLQTYFELGSRYMGLSHSRHNQVCDASTDSAPPLHNGLSEFGVQVVKELNRLGMMVDVSHISDEAFYDVLKVTSAPVIASHSNARAICDHPRNLDDDMIIALAENGGVLQLCVLSAYVKTLEQSPEREKAFAELREKWNNFQDLSDEEMDRAREEWWATNSKYPAPMATVADLVDHVDHVVNLVGIDYVGIGTDFDGGGALKDCYDVSELGNITLELVRRGYSKEDIRKIWSGNFMRVFREATELARLNE
ncbi:MAG: membrane dipeptidase [Bacteroidia bacterium]|nr:MAG: membrane dipeptidase [Bacteroidia bacterium]